ncbi:hypothetical protein [Plastoroseomonas hellenica]|nr:hypothetical protein [Plastoroseomonas hellenica]MBR0643728.1 hypothetical protein [Plastoroseomonas hellenica]
MGLMILDMISLNSLAAFTTEVSRNAGIQGGVQGVRDSSSTYGAQTARPVDPAQRPLQAVPPPPAQNLPRGSLLDLRV